MSKSPEKNNSIDLLEWTTIEAIFEGLPLLLRYPKHPNIWKYQKQYTEIICITHYLDSVKENGLPTSDYNKLLDSFDEEAVNCMNTVGILFLVETYSGSRNYWFYGKEITEIEKNFERLKRNNEEKQLELSVSEDSDWSFIDDYPVDLYER